MAGSTRMSECCFDRSLSRIGWPYWTARYCDTPITAHPYTPRMSPRTRIHAGAVWSLRSWKAFPGTVTASSHQEAEAFKGGEDGSHVVDGCPQARVEQRLHATIIGSSGGRTDPRTELLSRARRSKRPIGSSGCADGSRRRSCARVRERPRTHLGGSRLSVVRAEVHVEHLPPTSRWVAQPSAECMRQEPSST